MSDKSKSRRAEYQAKQEKKANHIVNWIFGILIGLGILYMIATIVMQA
jgi:tetrahydromethanopterin S-methyltransferase subunit B